MALGQIRHAFHFHFPPQHFRKNNKTWRQETLTAGKAKRKNRYSAAKTSKLYK